MACRFSRRAVVGAVIGTGIGAGIKRATGFAGIAVVACVIALPALLNAAASPQSNASGKQAGSGDEGYVLHQTTRRVLVDVVVKDAKGNPVRGLTKDDFFIKEDGKSQKVLSFDVEDSDKPDFTPPKVPPLPPDTFVNIPTEPERGPLYVILYDMVNTEPDDQATTIKPLIKFIDNKPPGTRFAIYLNTDSLHMLQGFTSDRALLHAALTATGPGPHIPMRFLNGRSFGQNDPTATVSILKFLAEYLEGIPGRKNLMWVAGDLPISLSADPDKESPINPDEVKEALAALMRSQISIYPVDVRGVVVTETHSVGTPGSAGSNGSSSAGISDTAKGQLNADALAAFTGGHAYYSDNDLQASLDEATAHGENYYTLSYSPSNEKYDYLARHISVKLEKKGYQLSYRQLYYALPEKSDKAKPLPETREAKFVAAKQTDSLYANIEHGAPMLHDLLFSAHLGTEGAATMATPEQMADLQNEPAYFRTRRKNATPKPLAPVPLQKYRIDYNVADPQLQIIAERTGRPAALEFAVAAYDAEGRMLNGIANEAMASAPADPAGKKGMRFRVAQELNVPPGAAWIRLAVRDQLTGHTGTLEVRLPLAGPSSGPSSALSSGPASQPGE